MNDSYWLSNPNQPLTGYPAIFGPTGTPQSLRTRLGHTMALQRLAGTDGYPGKTATSEIVRQMVLDSRVLSAQFKDQALAMLCAAGDAPAGSNRAAGCAALQGWDGKGLKTSRGSHLWDEFWTALTALKYYTAQITGHYGGKTADAVRAFQRDYNLTADGVCGPATLAEIRKAYSGSSSATTEFKTTVYNLSWFTNKTNGTLSAIGIARNQTAKLTDLTTNKSLNIHIQSTGNHIDVEPLTAADTTTLCEIYGVGSPSSISYKRRPMLLTTSKGVQVVCSIYGQPHGAEDIDNNNYDGQFCLHLLDSMTHGSSSVDAKHQAAIKSAVSIMSGKTVDGVQVTVKTVYP